MRRFGISLAVIAIAGGLFWNPGLGWCQEGPKLGVQEETIRAQILIRKGEYQKALDIFRGLVEANPDVPDLRADYANALLEAGELEKARQQIDMILAANSRNIRGHSLSAWYFLLKNEPAREAMERKWLARAVPHDKDNLVRLVELGAALGQPYDALGYTRKLFESDKADRDAARLLLAAIIATGDAKQLETYKSQLAPIFGSEKKLFLEAVQLAQTHGLEEQTRKIIAEYRFEQPDPVFLDELDKGLSPERRLMERIAKLEAEMDKKGGVDLETGLDLSALYLEKDDPKSAFSLLMLLAEAHPDSETVWTELLKIASWTDDPNKEKQALEKRLAVYPDDRAATKRLADVIQADVKTPVADRMARLRWAMNNYEHRQVFWTAYLEMAAANPLPPRELAYLKQLRNTTGNTGLLDRIGQVFIARDMVPDAIVAYEKIAALKPKDKAVRKTLAQYYQWVNAPDKYMAVLRDLLALDPNDAEVRLALAEAAMSQNDYDLAYDQFMWLQDRNLLKPEHRLSFVDVLIQKGRRHKAVAILRSFARGDSAKAAELHAAGQYALGLEEYATARNLLDAAITKDPSQYSVYKSLAIADMGLGRSDRAIKDIRRYLRNADNDFEAHFLLGEYLLHQGNRAAAMAAYARAERLIEAGRTSRP